MLVGHSHSLGYASQDPATRPVYGEVSMVFVEDAAYGRQVC
jgi:hypothetical protein